METCLYDSEYGFYMGAPSLGSHFITAPEISPLFGEMVGIWSLNTWQSQGSPSAVNLIELGPGRGFLTQDILRCWEKIVGKSVNLHSYLVEISPYLKETQAKTLTNSPYPLHWIGPDDPWPSGYSLIVANEFFDALPIHQYHLQDSTWYERGVTLKEGCLHDIRISLLVQPTFPTTTHFYEHCPALEHWARRLRHHITLHHGAALIIDYGYNEGGYKDTLQAVFHHRPVDIFAHPGQADLTAHVDFQALHTHLTAPGLALKGPIAQRTFLRQYGIEERLSKVCRDKPLENQRRLAEGVQRLVDPQGMGTLFQVISVESK